MHDANDFINTVKQIAVNAMNSIQPSNFCIGEVVNTSPLKVSIDQKMILGVKQLILTRNVTDFTIEVEFDLGTETETREVTIHNGLKVGDKVVLINEQGGQKYLILDKVVKP